MPGSKFRLDFKPEMKRMCLCGSRFHNPSRTTAGGDQSADTPRASLGVFKIIIYEWAREEPGFNQQPFVCVYGDSAPPLSAMMDGLAKTLALIGLELLLFFFYQSIKQSKLYLYSAFF